MYRNKYNKNIFLFDISIFYDYKTKTLKLTNLFNEELTYIPKETEKIIFKNDIIYYSSKFNKKIDNLLQNLINISLNKIFNQKVDKLPKNLTQLTFGGNFNQKVDNLPKNLTHLTFGSDFNQKVDKLPKNLIHLTFSIKFNKIVDNLPKNLTHLIFGRKFNKSLNNLPQKLEYLRLEKKFKSEIIIPLNTKTLCLSHYNNLIHNLPQHIEKLYIKFSNRKNHEKKIDNLPLTIKEIIIEDKKFEQFIKIPFGTILTIESNKIKKIE